jgi:GT2 family glycosyltransferase
VPVPEVVVSVLAFHSGPVLEACVRACLALEYNNPVTVLVHEQGEDDEDWARLRDLERDDQPGDRLVLSRGRNQGYAGGHNRVLRTMAAPFFLPVNADAVLRSDFLAEALACFGPPDVAAVQPTLLAMDPVTLEPLVDESGCAVIDSAGLQPMPSREIVNRGQGEAAVGQFTAGEEIFGADGAAPLYRRAALLDVAVPRAGTLEFFDEDFFAYKEDVDLAWRLQLRGWRTLYAPGAVGWHVRGAAHGSASGVVSRLRHRRQLPVTARRLGFANHRLMQLKNERWADLRRDLSPWLRRELLAWAVALSLDPVGYRAVVRMGRLVPRTLHKRRWIQGHAKADAAGWFAPQTPTASR